MQKLTKKLAFLLIVAAVILLSVVLATAVCAEITGSGTEEDPYVVGTWAELKLKMNEGGYIKLSADVADPDKTEDSALAVPDGKKVDLDVNGHTVDRGGKSQYYGYVIYVGGNGSELSIRDSVGGGRITGGYHKKHSNYDLTGGCIFVRGGTVNLYGGEISGNKVAGKFGSGRSCSGGGIAFVGGTFNMYGGAVKNNAALNYGGGVYIEDATFNMYDGEISGNTNASRGAGVYLTGNSVFNMSGGRISDNNTGSDGYGGGVYLANISSNTVSAAFNMSGGEISENRTQTGEFYNSCGGASGVFVSQYDFFNMTGGSITGNVSPYNSSYYNIPGASVIVNGTVNFSGGAKIYGNMAENTNQYAKNPIIESNLSVRNDYYDARINVVGEFADDAHICFASQKIPTAEEPVKAISDFGTYNPGKNATDYFYSDQLFSIQTNDDGDIMLYPHVHEMKLVPEVPANCNNTGKRSYYCCETCKKYYEDEKGNTEIDDLESWGVLPKTAHTYEYVEKVEPTCKDPGKAWYFVCAICGRKITLEDTDDPTPVLEQPELIPWLAVVINDFDNWGNIPATGKHTEVADETVEPTCEEPGLTAGSHCSACGEIIIAQETIEALGHEEVTVAAVEPTYTETGLTEGKNCARCGKVLVSQEIVPVKAAETEKTPETEKAPETEKTPETEKVEISVGGCNGESNNGNANAGGCNGCDGCAGCGGSASSIVTVFLIAIAGLSTAIITKKK